MTRQEWFDTLKPKVQKQFKYNANNCNEEKTNFFDYWISDNRLLTPGIRGAFPFSQTKEGFKYWDNIDEKAYKLINGRNMTGKEWVKTLPKKVKKAFINNCDTLNPRPFFNDWCSIVNDIYGAGIIGAFVFDKSPEGHEYWKAINDKLISKHEQNE